MAKSKPIKRWKVPFADDDEGRDRFKVCAAAVRAVFGEYAKGLDNLRTCNKLMDKLESVSTEVATRDNSGQERTTLELDSGGGEILLEANEMSMLRKMVTDDKIGWLPHISHAAEETIDWLNGNELIAEVIAPTEEEEDA